MANIAITNIDTGSIALRNEEFADDSITFAGADVLAAGTILARATTTGKLVIYAKGGSTDGNGVPVAVLTYPVTATTAGNVAARVLISGTVNASRLVIDADGDASNVDATVLDDLRNVGIVGVPVDQLGRYDNPQ